MTHGLGRKPNGLYIGDTAIMARDNEELLKREAELLERIRILERWADERAQLTRNLTAVQERCTALLEENRELRAELERLVDAAEDARMEANLRD